MFSFGVSLRTSELIWSPLLLWLEYLRFSLRLQRKSPLVIFRYEVGCVIS
jgi:hypothetical protein